MFQPFSKFPVSIGPFSVRLFTWNEQSGGSQPFFRAKGSQWKERKNARENEKYKKKKTAQDIGASD